MVWKRSTKLGCGINGVYVVCRYCEEPGNEKSANGLDEEWKNVFPKKDGCEDVLENRDGST